jgi:hypothetical protein
LLYLVPPSRSGITLHSSNGPAEQHSIMGDADNFDYAVHPHAVDAKVPWAADALARINEPATQAKRVNPDTNEPCDVL